MMIFASTGLCGPDFGSGSLRVEVLLTPPSQPRVSARSRCAAPSTRLPERPLMGKLYLREGLTDWRSVEAVRL